MVRISEPSLANEIGKRLAPALSSCLLALKLGELVRATLSYGHILLGQGSATGWDMKSEIKVARKYIDASNPVLFDVGAYSGGWSVPLYIGLQGNCRIYQFEPNPQLAVTLLGQQRPGLKVIPFALGDRPGEAVLYAPEGRSAASSLTMRHDSEFAMLKYQEFPVLVTTLDAFLELEGIDVVDFMKIDTEGNELAVLKGGMGALSSRKIKTIQFEFGSGQINSRTFFYDFWKVLSGCGYRLWRLCPGGGLVPIQSYYEDLEYYRGVSNYLASLV